MFLLDTDHVTILQRRHAPSLTGSGREWRTTLRPPSPSRSSVSTSRPWAGTPTSAGQPMPRASCAAIGCSSRSSPTLPRRACSPLTLGGRDDVRLAPRQQGPRADDGPGHCLHRAVAGPASPDAERGRFLSGARSENRRLDSIALCGFCPAPSSIPDVHHQRLLLDLAVVHSDGGGDGLDLD